MSRRHNGLWARLARKIADLRSTESVYDEDGLRSFHNHDFICDPEFQRAYKRGMQAAGKDFHWRWRVHVGLWAAQCAMKLSGDFVECGVGHGFMSSAIVTQLDWDATGRTFYLLDSFAGIDERYVSSEERAAGIMDRNALHIEMGLYSLDEASVRANFSEWKNVKLIAGSIPSTLSEIDAQKIAYLHIDLNNSPPEVAALQFLWERLVPGAFVLLDDYAGLGYNSQKIGVDSFAGPRGVAVLSLPTGQGLIIKPA